MKYIIRDMSYIRIQICEGGIFRFPQHDGNAQSEGIGSDSYKLL